MARRRRGWSDSSESGWRPYVSVAKRRVKAEALIARARKKGQVFQPVQVEGRTIAKTPWGKAWCEHCESYGDYENRLPRGRTYVRNGSVIDLTIREGAIEARVYGSALYEQVIAIRPCQPAVWKRVKKRCSGRVGSLIELLEGRVSGEIMADMMAEDDGILPTMSQVSLDCSCPDWSRLCKHLAAVLYGVGARLDEQPELLFTLRGVDPAELVSAEGLTRQVAAGRAKDRRLDRDLSSVFGIDLDEDVEPKAPKARKPPRAAKKRGATAAKPARKKATKAAASKKAPTATARKKAKAKPKTAPARKRSTPRRASRAATVTRRELLDRGLPSGTISSWVRDGSLEATAERGVYRHTRESRARLRDRGV